MNKAKLKVSFLIAIVLVFSATIIFCYSKSNMKSETKTIQPSPLVNNQKDADTIEVPNEKIYHELELHENIPKTCSFDEVDSIVNEGMKRYEIDGRNIISTDDYVSDILNSNYDSDSLELKSYIYHMMLNSIDYFDTAEGKMTYALNMEYPIDLEFQTNIPLKTSYENESQFNKSTAEYYVSDMKIRRIDSQTKEYTEQVCAQRVEFTVGDNDRFILLDNGESVRVSRNDLTNLGVSGNSCLFPQTYAFLYLTDFDKWELSKVVEFLGRKCIEIRGENNDEFVMYIDINTGIMLKLERYKNGVITGYIKVDSISIDNNVEVKQFDSSLYKEKTDFYPQ